MLSQNRKRIPCTIMRGGTSRGVYMLENYLPKEENERDALLLKLMGSPDVRQINGLGGAASVTSKVAIVGVSGRPDADVDYTFAQVAVDKPVVSYKGNCGNISSGVGPFAIEQGLVKITEPVTSVRIYNTNTDKIIVEEVQVEQGAVKYHGDFSIAGVAGTGAPIKLKFVNPAGSISGRLLPTGNAVDVLEVPDLGALEVSIVDAANPLVFVRAKDLGLTGKECPAELDADEEKLALLETVRGLAAVKMGLIEDYKESAWKMPGIPKMTFVAEPEDYVTSGGETVAGDRIDLLSRMMSMQKAHPTYAMTGAMCTAVAAVIPGSIVNQVIRKEADTDFIRIGHAGGVLEAGVEFHTEEDGGVAVESAFGFRTANLILEGVVFI